MPSEWKTQQREDATRKRLATPECFVRDSVWRQTCLGDTYLRDGKSDLALAAYRQAWQIVQEYPTMVAQDRHSVRALAGLAASYAAQSEREHSKELLSQALEKLGKAGRPQSGAAGANLADLYYSVCVAHARAGNHGRSS